MVRCSIIVFLLFFIFPPTAEAMRMKYDCVVEHVVGIDINEDGDVYTGKFRFDDRNFSLVIEHSEELCGFDSAGLALIVIRPSRVDMFGDNEFCGKYGEASHSLQQFGGAGYFLFNRNRSFTAGWSIPDFRTLSLQGTCARPSSD